MKNKWLCSLIFIFAACSSPPQQAFRINIDADPHTLDPHKARDLSAINLTRMLFEGLTRTSAASKPELALAEKVEISEDLKHYTFTLRQSFWSNGDPLVAEDFAAAWKKALHPTFLAANAFLLYPIKNARAAKEGKVSVSEIGVRAKDAKTLEVELENPTPYFLELTAFPVYFPSNQRAQDVYNGPFVLAEWKHGNQVKMKKNGRYWDQKHVHTQNALMVVVTEGMTALNLFEKEELDWAGSPMGVLPPDALRALEKQGKLKQKPLLGTYFLRLNTLKSPFCDVEMRRAFALALQRESLLEYQIPATGLLPPVMGVQEKPYFVDGDVELATTLFKEKIERPLTYIYSAGERNHIIAQALQQQWYSAFGLWVELQPLERKVYLDRLAKLDYDIAAGSWIADFNDPINFLEVFKFKEGTPNNTGWENAEYIDLLRQTEVVLGSEERRSLFQRAECLLMQEMPIIPIFHYTMLYLQGEQVSGVTLSSTGMIDIKYAEVK